ncbi:LysR family transcriptional regulator [Camelimonas abortus]|uniref:LysR family transcriptional regulator n=1 Tax=Camelimonas abortus TaxID=1017184 RepID=A0ABV7LAN1_9HYPH
MKHLRTLACILDVAKTGSIRKSAERLALTPSALTRKIQDFEQEMGVELFERLPHGMRLNPAGELVVRHIRDQLSDFERVRTQIADLSGERRGHVSVACSQAFANEFLPVQVAAYRREHPLVSFSLMVRDYDNLMPVLSSHEADFAVALKPPPAPEFHTLLMLDEPVCALFAADHPLAGREGPVRLRECLRFPVIMPDRSLALRHLLDAARMRMSAPLQVALETGSFEVMRGFALAEHAVSFQIRGGIPRNDPRLAARVVDPRDMAPAQIVVGHLRGRTLPVAAAKFMEQVLKALVQGEAGQAAGRDAAAAAPAQA